MSNAPAASGEYRFTNLPVGTYDITANGQGFAPQTIRVPIELNKTATGRIALAVGPASTTVEVSGAAPAIDTTTAQLQTTYDLAQTQNLPIASSGSGVLNLSMLQAGVSSSGGIGAGSGPSVGGQRPRNNNFTVEGVDNNDKGVTGPLLTIPNDAVQNLTVMTNQYSPEFGHSTGGQFNQVVISGTNKFHGMVYDYLQNARNLNALDPQQRLAGVKRIPRLDDNRFGGQIGGPIVKNKLFFFVNYTYEPIGFALTPGTTWAPTASGYSALGSASGVNAANVSTLQKYAVAPTACATGPNCPALTVGGRNIQIGILPLSTSTFTNKKYLATSADWDISDRDQFRLRYLFNQTAAQDTAATLPAFWTTNTTPDHLVTLSEYHTFSPSVTNELRIGFNRNGTNFTVPNLSYPGLDAFPNVLLEDLNLNLGPDPNAPQFSFQNLYQLTDNITFIHKNHTFKFGVDTAKYISPQKFIQRSRGDYDYTDSALFFTDQVPDDLAERSFGSVGYSGDQYWIYGYGNDIWKVTPTISLNLGLRYEFLSIPFGWTQQNLNSIASVPGLISFDTPVAPKKDFAPRVGFAWAPGNGNTSIRGGFGMGYDVLYDNIGTLSRPPQIGSTTDCPGGAGCGPDSAFLRGGGIKSTGQTGITNLNSAFCASQGLTGLTDAGCARAFTASFLPPKVKYPYSEQWNLGVQHAFGQNDTIEVRYVGTRGVHLNVQDRINRIAKVDSTHFLPLFMSQPSAATTAGLSQTLTAISARPSFRPDFAAAGFNLGSIVAFEPYGGSTYHGMSTQWNHRMSKGLQFQVAWTWSHAIDDSTADFFSTVLTPRRPQDFQNLHPDKSNSALDHAHRLTASAVWQMPWFKNSNWLMRNVVGNWEVDPIYTFESGEWADPQSSQDANGNGDSAGDRVVINPSGNRAISSDVTPLKNSAGATVGYVANNPNAYWIRARLGMLTNSGRNILRMRPTDDIDLAIAKAITFREHYSLRFGAQARNVVNHPQYMATAINDIVSNGNTAAKTLTYLVPGQANFNNPELTFSGNPRTIQLFLKLAF